MERNGGGSARASNGSRVARNLEGEGGRYRDKNAGGNTDGDGGGERASRAQRVTVSCCLIIRNVLNGHSTLCVD